MKKKILKGTIILTAAGLITRVLGLYNRVFLANIISAAQLGLYQLIFPVMNVCLALCCYGIETAMSKTVAAHSAVGSCKNMHRVVRLGLGLALSIAIALCFIVFIWAKPIAALVLQEPACEPYLKIMAMALPFSTMHACTLGYFFGVQKSGVPAISQLIEQIVRVAMIYGLSMTIYTGKSADGTLAVWGLLVGEAASCVFTVTGYKVSAARHIRQQKRCEKNEVIKPYRGLFRELWQIAYPMTISRFLLTMLSGVEAVLVPLMLKIYCGDATKALEIYGVVMGMAFPFVMFPTTLTNALSTMVLPAVANASAKKDYNVIRETISRSIHYCLLIGVFAMTIFFFYGNLLGITIFKNEMAGSFLRMFAMLCPFIYASSALAGTLNGLGKVKMTLIHNVISLVVRIGFLVLAVPKVGIQGYMWGMLGGYLVLFILGSIQVKREVGLDFNPWKTLIFPMLFAIVSAMFSMAAYEFMIHFMMLPMIVVTMCVCLVFVGIYGGSLWLGKIIQY